MKAIINIVLFTLVVFTISSCTTETVPEEAQVTIFFEHVVDENGLEANSPFNYLNSGGNRYNVSALNYVISNVVLIDLGDNEVALNNSNTIDGFGGSQLDPVVLPNGTYKSMRFDVSAFNHQGKFLDGSSAEQNISIDFTGGGLNESLEMPVGGLTVNGAAKTAYITFNLNAVYGATTDFNNGATQAEVTPSFANAFTFSGSYTN